jgi:chromosome segregation ATPase
MIESLMLIALGFFVATLFAAIAAQFVWRRAVTVTTRSLVDTEAGAAEEARVRELDDLMQRHRRETAPLELEINRLRKERDALAAANEELTQQTAAQADEIDALRAEAGRQGTQADALRDHIARNAAEAAGHIAAVKQEIAALEAAIGGLPPQSPPQDSAAPLAVAATEELPEEAKGNEAGAEPSADEEEDSRTLAEVKASLARLDAMTEDDRTAPPAADDRLTDAHIGDKALLARIRALEAGVAN